MQDLYELIQNDIRFTFKDRVVSLLSQSSSSSAANKNKKRKNSVGYQAK